MRDKEIINGNSKRNEKIGKFFISTNSKEYQRMLAGVRIYFSLMTQRSFINGIIGLLFGVALVYTIFSLMVFYSPTPMSFFFFTMPLAFFLIPMIIVLLVINLKEFGFRLFKGYLITLKNSLFFSFSSIIFLIIIILIINSESIEMQIFLIGYFFTLQFAIVFAQTISVKNSSLISYAKEKLSDIIKMNISKETRGLTSKYELFYYSIHTYYRRFIKDLKSRYKDDVLLYFQFDKIPILASQIHTFDGDKRDYLNYILTKLEETTPLLNPDEFIEIMKDIDKNFRHSLCLPDNVMILRDLFRERPFLENIKFFLIPLIPIVSIIVNIYINYFAENFL